MFVYTTSACKNNFPMVCCDPEILVPVEIESIGSAEYC